MAASVSVGEGFREMPPSYQAGRKPPATDGEGDAEPVRYRLIPESFRLQSPSILITGRPMPPFLVPFLVYWLILYVAFYITVEFAQNYLYDETTALAWLKVGIGSALLAAFLTYTQTGFDTILTEGFGWSVIQAIAWFVVFTLVFRFQPIHAFAIGVCAFFILAGTATLAVDSLTGKTPTPTPLKQYEDNEMLRRRPMGPAAPGIEPAPKKAETKP